MEGLLGFLDERRWKEKDHLKNEVTHTMMSCDLAKGGKFVIQDDELQEFHRLYARAIKCRDVHVSLIERHLTQGKGPFVFDFDFKYRAGASVNENLWNDDRFLRPFLTIIAKKLFTYVDVPTDDPSRGEIFVFAKGTLRSPDTVCPPAVQHAKSPRRGVQGRGDDEEDEERPTPRSGEGWVDEDDEEDDNENEALVEYKDGLHIMIPRVRTRPEIQLAIRQEIVDEGEMEELMRSWDVEFTTPFTDVYDKSVLRSNGWMMLGSHKVDSEAYGVHSIWQATPTTVTLINPDDDDSYDKYFGPNILAKEMMQQFSIRTNKVSWHSDETNFGTELIDEYTRVQNLHRTRSSTSVVTSGGQTAVRATEEDIELARELVECLNDERARGYEEWRNVGFVLHYTDSSLLDTFIEFSKRGGSAFRSEQDVCQMWRNIDDNVPNPLTLGSLKNWAREDNADMYNRLMQSKADHKYEKCCDTWLRSQTDDNGKEKQVRCNWADVVHNVTEVLYPLYMHRFVCSSYKHQTWWKFKDHRWVECELGLRKLLSTDAHAAFGKYADEQKQRARNEDQEGAKKCERRAQAAREIANKMRNPTCADLLMRKCCEKFLWKELLHSSITEGKTSFMQVLNNDIYMLGMKNGVYDLRTHEFRDGRSEDWVSMSTYQDYKDLALCEQCGGDHRYCDCPGARKCIVCDGSDYTKCACTQNICDCKWCPTCNTFDVRTCKGNYEDGSIGASCCEAGPCNCVCRRCNETYADCNCHTKCKRPSAGDADADGDDYVHVGDDDGEERAGNASRSRNGAADDSDSNHSKAPQIPWCGPYPIPQYPPWHPIHFKNHPNKTVREIFTFLVQVMPDPQQRDYVLTILAASLDGNVLENFHIWVGVGGNGKSKLVELLQRSVGDYAGTIPVSAITQKRGGSSAATPEVSRLDSKRFVVMHEPEKGEQINAGRMKELTGGDMIYARPLYIEGYEFKPQWTIVMPSNVTPDVAAEDGGVWRRMKVSTFTSKFVEEPNPKRPEEKPIDVNLAKKMEQWYGPFIWILTEYYKKYQKEGLYEPMVIKSATKKYQDSVDYVGAFLSSAVIDVLNPSGDEAAESRLICDDLWDRYKSWSKAQQLRTMSLQELKDYLRKNPNYGEATVLHTDPDDGSVVKGWTGKRLKEGGSSHAAM